MYLHFLFTSEKPSLIDIVSLQDCKGVHIECLSTVFLNSPSYGLELLRDDLPPVDLDLFLVSNGSGCHGEVNKTGSIRVGNTALIGWIC